MVLSSGLIGEVVVHQVRRDQTSVAQGLGGGARQHHEIQTDMDGEKLRLFYKINKKNIFNKTLNKIVAFSSHKAINQQNKFFGWE